MGTLVQVQENAARSTACTTGTSVRGVLLGTTEYYSM